MRVQLDARDKIAQQSLNSSATGFQPANGATRLVHATALVAHRNFGNQDQMIHFLKNVAMAGGFLQVAAFRAGGWSLDARRGTVALHRSRH
jgi:uncharacterized membrane protein YphA (DoxX/SURF4 family)